MLSLSQVCTTLLQAIFSFRRGLARGIRVTKRTSLTELFFLGSRNDKKVSEHEQQHPMDLETNRFSPKSKTRAKFTLRGPQELEYSTFSGSPGRLSECVSFIDPRNLKTFLSLSTDHGDPIVGNTGTEQ